MFMTAITGVLAIAVTGMTHPATDIVVSIQYKILVVIKFRGRPMLGAVALLATSVDLPMKIVARRFVTDGATSANGSLQQGVRELLATALRRLRSQMIAVADHAIALDELLVKRRLHVSPRQRSSLGCAQTDAGQCMATDAALRIGATPRRVTGKTAISKLDVALQ
jgi:hypothetical protein